MALPYDRFLNFIFAWLAAPFIAAGKYEEFLMNLEAPLPGEVAKRVAPKEWAHEDSGFDDLLGMVAGMG